MITRNKLSNQPENKLTTKFQPINLEEDSYEQLPGGKPKKPRVKNKKKDRTRSKIKWSPAIWLPLLLVAVAIITYLVIMVISNNVYPGGNGKLAEEISEASEPETKPEEANNAKPDTSEGSADTEVPTPMDDNTADIQPITGASSNNPTIKYGKLMLINPNFTVEQDFIAARKSELVSLQSTYGILELNAYNGDNLLDREAATAINKMLSDYTIANPGHSIQTVSCFREVGTNCGRLCAATGTSDHHTGLTCDLIDPVYGTSLDTNDYEKHLEWQWLKNNSYKYGFIDRFPEAWAGGSMDEPLNVNAEGTTGLYETWHFRYVGVHAATEIATGVYNNGAYDSLEHYLLARGLVANLLNN